MSSKAASPNSTDKAPQKSKKMLFMIIGLVIILAGGGGYFFLASKKAAAEASEDSDHSGKKEQAKRPVFVPLDPFTVNLADAGSEKMAQISINLQISDPKMADEIKAFMPAIRHNVLKIISSKESRELLTGEGKDKLAEEIAVATAAPLGWSPADDEPTATDKPGKPATQGISKADTDKDQPSEKSSAKPAASDKIKVKKQKRRAPPPNPIEQVHFSQFIIQ